MRKRLLSVAVALVMTVGLLAGAIGSAAAAPSTTVANWIFFPSVPNGETVQGTGPWYGSITIQNLEDAQVNLSFNLTADATPFARAILPAHGARTFSVAALFAHLPASSGTGVAVEATWNSGTHTVAPVIAGVEKQATPETNAFGVTTSDSDLVVDGYTAISAADVAWGPSSAECANVPSGACNDLGQSFLGLPVANFFNGSSNSFNFDGTSYLPIVQANWSGWNTTLNVTNIDASTPANTAANVTVTFYQAGTANQVAGTATLHLAAGETTSINVASYVGSAGFVGSAKITSSYAVVANTVRVKSSTNMAIINTSAPSLLTTSSTLTTVGSGIPVIYPSGANAFSLNAPLVYRNYNGWNTGINIVNTSTVTNNITVTFYTSAGTAVSPTSTVAIPGSGMGYVYIPALASSGTSDFGQAVITGNAPFYAAVDEVKYSTGDAMSYMATGSTLDMVGAIPCDSAANPCDFGNTLALPLFQNGTITGGVAHGDTSGIDLFNPGSANANGTISFYNLNGSAVTSLGTVPFAIVPNGGAFFYPPTNMTGLMSGQFNAIVTVTSGRVSAVSNNVNYDVNGDGGSVFTLSNPYGQYRSVCTGEACGIEAVNTGS